MEKSIELYTVTTIGFENEKKKLKKYHERTPAICTTLARAKKILETNEGSLDEAGYYPLAVIELTQPNRVYPAVFKLKGKSQWWYRFNDKADKYVPCRRPSRFKGVLGFGIG